MTKLGVWESLLRKYARIDDEWFVKEWVPAATEKKEPANLFAKKIKIFHDLGHRYKKSRRKGPRVGPWYG